jgi:hypothetical protein
MNPFLYPALIVLCLFGMLIIRDGPGGLAPLAGITACMLSSIGLAATTGTGTRGAVVTTVLMIACVACVIFLGISSEKRSRERRLRMYA